MDIRDCYGEEERLELEALRKGRKTSPYDKAKPSQVFAQPKNHVLNTGFISAPKVKPKFVGTNKRGSP